MADTLTPPTPAPRERASCLNCGAALAGPFCHGCGQRDEPPDLPARRIAQEALGAVLAWDGRAVQSLRDLIGKPGLLAEDWAAGRRVRHVAPFRLYLIVSLLYVGATAGYELAKDVLIEPDATAETVDDDREQFRNNIRGSVPTDKVELIAGYTYGMLSLGSRWMFVLMPLGGFGLFVLYGLRRRSYAAHFVLAIHVFTVVMMMLALRRVLQTIVVLISHERLSELSHGLNDVIVVALLVLATVYAAASIRRFYGVGWGKAVASAPAVTVGPLVGWMVLFIAGYIVILVLP